MQALVRLDLLPPVDQRLPRSPKVVQPTVRTGIYGGTWRMVMLPVADGAQFIRTVAYEPLVRWTSDWSGIEPNLVERYSVNANSTQYTFTLRRGLRWSDGMPFTTADIRFWYKDVLSNPALTLVVPSWLKSHTQVAKFRFIDDITFVVEFSSPNTLFLEQLAAPESLVITSFPAHYAQKFHKDYLSPGDLDKLIAEGHYSSWADMFVKRVGVNAEDIGNFIDPSRPRMSAWILSNSYKPDAVTVTWNRNPYYWKVDTEGNQLPYLDAVNYKVVKNMDEAVNQAINGEIDMQNLSEMGVDVGPIFGTDRNPLYNLNPLVNGSNNVMVISLNMTSSDPVFRQMFQNQNFRIGLSYAIDRQEILNLLYGGRGTPWQAAPLENSPFYDPIMGKQYTEYNVEKANEYLDRAGYRKDQFGKRLRSDGLPISFTVDVLENDPQQIAMLNIVAKYWAAVGIDIQPKPDSLPIFLATVHSNLHQAAAYHGGATYFSDVLTNPSNFLPVSMDSFWAVPWANWFTGVAGYEGQQPDDTVRTSMEMYDRMRMTQNTENQIKVMKGALVVARESFWTIGIAAGPQQYGLVRRNFYNVPVNMPSAWIYPDPGPANPEQFFIQ